VEVIDGMQEHQKKSVDVPWPFNPLLRILYIGSG